MKGSAELRIFLREIRAGALTATAAEVAGIGIGEAVLHAQAEAKGEYHDIETDPETAGCAATTQKEIVMQDEPEIEVDLPVAELAADTLRGDVRDAFLSWFKATPKPWSQMSEGEQRSFADTADRAARNLVHQACRFIAANERVTIVATLVEYKEKDGVEAKLKLASKGEIVAALHEACGREVLIVTSGEEEFAGEAAPAEIDADQPELNGIGAEYEEAA